MQTSDRFFLQLTTRLTRRPPGGRLAILTLAAVLLLGNSTRASDLAWDSSPATPLANDGSGTWDTSTNNWLALLGTVVNTTWTNANPDNALFGNNGAAGTVTLGSAITVGNITFNNVTSGTYLIAGPANDSVKVLTLGTAGSTITTNAAGAISAVLAGAAGSTLTKAGSATLTLSGANSYSGATVIGAGTLNAAAASGKALGGTSGITLNATGTLLTSTANQINPGATLSLAGGTFNTAGNSETLGALTLTANSTIDLGNGTSILGFGGASTRSAGLLTISNWSGTRTGGGTDQIVFANRLDASFLSNIQFTGFAQGALELGNGEIVPVAEPSTVLAGALMIGLLGWSQRRDLHLLLNRQPRR